MGTWQASKHWLKYRLPGLPKAPASLSEDWGKLKESTANMFSAIRPLAKGWKAPGEDGKG